jgi:cyclase
MSISVSRRQFVIGAVVAVAGGVLGVPRAWGQPEKPGAKLPDKRASGTFNRWVEVKPGLHVAIGRTGDDMALVGGNSTLVATKHAAALIDTKQAVTAPALRREALTKTGGIVEVFNTHHHFDHTGGNGVFSREAALTAHPKCCDRVRAMGGSFTGQLKSQIEALKKADVEGAEQAAKDAEAFAEKLGELKEDAWTPKPIAMDKVKDIAGKKVEVHHVGAGHTDNDLFFFFPEDNVLVAGDLVFNGLHPYYDKDGGANSEGWMKSLGRIVQLCDDKTVVVPGHGDIGDVEIVKKQIQYFEDARAAVQKAIDDGKAKEEVSKMVLPQYAAYRLQIAQPLVMGGVFDELKK